METTSFSRGRWSQPIQALLLYSASCLVTPIAAAPGGEFAGGTGEPNDPYQIATAEQLISIGSDPNLLSRHFVLVADIDLDPNQPGGKVFTQAVIAPFSPPFSGSLDGRGHVVRNLVINAQTSPGGLIGVITVGGTVKGLSVENARISSGSSAGGLVVSNDGDIVSCSSTGSVTGGWAVGGLVGGNFGNIVDCHTAGDVSGVGEVGGLVGFNCYGSVSNSCSTGSVSSTGDDVGGLVGDSYRGSVSNSCSTGSVSGTHGVGGLVGHNGSAVSNSYSEGSVTGDCDVGGLVGWSSSGTVSSSFWDMTTSGRNTSDGGTGLTTAQMQDPNTFLAAGWDFWGNRLDGVSDDWFMPKGSYPVLCWQTDKTGLLAIPDVRGLTLDEAERALEAVGLALAKEKEVQGDWDRTIPPGHVLRAYYPRLYAAPGGEVELLISSGPYDWAMNPGDGTPAGPHQIRTASQLESLLDHPERWDRYFVLTGDVDMAGRTYSTALIAPDANAADGFQGMAFTGGFDGQGFKILNLAITSRTNDYLGLFGFVGRQADVRRVHLVAARITGGAGSYYVGTLAGYNAGAIRECSATGMASGNCKHTGSLIGENVGYTADNALGGAGTARYCGEQP